MKDETIGVVSGDNVVRQSISVATLGLEERSRLVLANALNKHANGLCVLADSSQAHVALIDLDNRDAKSLLNDFRHTFPSIPLVGLGKQQTDPHLHAFIVKPVNLELLLATIVELADPALKQATNMITDDKIAKAMQALENKNIAKSLNKRAEQIQTKTAAKRAMPGKTDEMCFDPERFLLGAILNAVSQAANNNQTAVLTCWNDRIVVIDPDQGKIISNLTDNQIRNLAIAPIDDNLSSPIHSRFYPAGEVNRELNVVLGEMELRHFSQETFLWNLGLMTCRGRIPAEFTVCNRHYLRRWPNLTRVNVPPNAMRILAYWSQQACSLTDLKEQLDIPYQDVFNVFSAAYAAGLTGEARRKSDQIMQVIGLNEHKSRSLMKSIISRFRGNKSEQIPKTA